MVTVETGSSGPDDTVEGGITAAGRTPVDMANVLAEIHEEARRLRTSGAVPASYERRLDRIFAGFVPHATVDAEFADAIRAADAHSFVNIDVPTDAANPVVRFVKRFLRKLMAWYLNYVTRQVVQFGRSSMNVHRIIAARVAEIESRTGGGIPASAVDLAASLPAIDTGEHTATVAAALGSVRGRILHLGCGTGDLMAALMESGLDVYGVEPDGERADIAVGRGLDVWPDEPLTHLARVGDGKLSGLVVSGFVDASAPGTLWELLRLAAEKLAGGAPLVVIARTPGAWSRDVSPVAADLSPGRPLHSETWTVLLAAHEFDDVSVHDGAPGEQLVDVPGADPALSANIALLNRTIFGPATVTIVARASAVAAVWGSRRAGTR